MARSPEIVSLTELKKQFEYKGVVLSGVSQMTVGFHEYATDLGFGTPRNLERAIHGKDVIDVTAGYATFAQQAKTHVISINPCAPFLVTFEPSSHHPGYIATKKRDMVCAFTDEGLPFPSNYFDWVFDRNGFLIYYESHALIVRKAFDEMKRVLKKNGEIRTAEKGGKESMRGEYNDVFMSLGLTIQRYIWDRTVPTAPLVKGFVLTK